MYQEHKFTFTHQELVSYVKRYLASCGITEYDCWEKSYDTEDWYGFKTHWDTCRIFGLPAPYNIGHIQIDIINTHISFRLIAKQERKLDEDEQKLYKTDIIKTADDIWVFEMPDAEKDERWADRRTGFNYGYEIHEHNIQQFNDFLNTIFKEKYNTMFVVQLAAECYEKQRMIKEFEELAANAWHLHKKLWDTINDFSTQWGETDRMNLINRYNLSFKAKDETEGQSQDTLQ